MRRLRESKLWAPSSPAARLSGHWPPADGRLQAPSVGHCRGRACLGEQGDTERVGAHWG